MQKLQFYKILFLVIFLLFADILYVYIEGTLIGYHSTIYWPTGEPYNFWSGMFASAGVAIVAGLVIGFFEVLYFGRLLRKKPFGITLLVKTSFYVFNIFFFTSLAVALNLSYQVQSSIFSKEVITSFAKYISNPVFIMIMIYWSIAMMLALFILHVNDKFGKGVLFNFLIGKYHQPRDQIRIFMFLDISSSTTIAEKIGAQKFSALLRDFFFDLDEVINKTRGAIYQFVGDEVIVIWDLKNGTKNSNCARLFFLAEEKINSLKQHYLKRYGVYPTFKAGLHYGKVIVTEVGGSKQEIAYHGDTINTAARIRSTCNEVNKNLLISEALLHQMPDIRTSFSVESIGVFKLKGKKRDIGLFSIDKAS